MRPLVLIPCLALLAVAPPARAEPAGEVTYIKGTLERVVGEARTPLAVDGPIDSGDHLVTGPRSAAELLFKDGTVVRLAASSDLEVKDLEVPPSGPSLKARLVLAAGSVWASVIHLTGGGEFEVATPWAVAGVRGTKFRVDASPAAGAVEVYRGRVEVASAGERGPGDRAPVLPGQRLAIDPAGFHLGAAAPPDDFGRWAAERPRPSRPDFVRPSANESRVEQRAERRTERRELRRERR
jgi:hypothetical protein